jgi:hypothetical protein
MIVVAINDEARVNSAVHTVTFAVMFYILTIIIA